MRLVQTATFRTEVLLPGLLAARAVRAFHEPVTAVFVDVQLNMAPGYDLLAALVPTRTPHSDIIAHIEQ